MAKLIGRALAGGRGVPSMEFALVGLLFVMVIIGSLTDLDFQVRMALGPLISDLHTASTGSAGPVASVAVPK
ncbi:MAG: hypothetical protein MJE12_26815 [Alphaproteobacteria bacterium]|nr:hypothetical protein [Alphaproteobacteria bacterium]